MPTTEDGEAMTQSCHVALPLDISVDISIDVLSKQILDGKVGKNGTLQ